MFPCSSDNSPTSTTTAKGEASPTFFLDEDAAFLTPHWPELRKKSLLSFHDITRALVEQVEALLRRASHTDEEDEDDDEEDSVRGPTSVASFTARIPSLFAPTVITTLSSDTRKAGNHSRSRRQGADPSPQPRIVGGMEFVQSETLRKKIHNIIVQNGGEPSSSSWFERSFFFGLLGTASPSHRLIQESRLFSCTTPCLSHSIKDAEAQKDLEFQRQVQHYAAVLHLRMKMKSFHYYKLHFSRRRPHHPYTKAIQANLQTTPWSQLSSSDVPDARRVSSDESTDSSSAASFLSALDFGIGPPAQPIQLLVTDTVFLDLALTGSLGWNPPKARPRAAFRDRKVLLAPEEHLVLLNRRSGVPLAVCTRMGPAAAGRVRMYTTRRRHGQMPDTTTDQCGLRWCNALPLYTWAEFHTERSSSKEEEAYPMASYTIHMVEEGGGGALVPRFHAKPSQGRLCITGRTSREFRRSGCATLSMCQEDPESDIFWKLSLAQGMDPALFICFASFVDEMIEYTMRMQCKEPPRKMAV